MSSPTAESIPMSTKAHSNPADSRPNSRAVDDTIDNDSKSSTEKTSPTPAEKAVPAIPAPAQAAAPPKNVDGGLLCWLQVIGSFVVWTNTFGLANVFGSFQTYYEGYFGPTVSPSKIAWIGSLQPFLLLGFGIISGPAYDAGYFRHLMVAGNGLIVIGLMTTSVCKEYWQFILAQGVCVGLGMGLVFTPGMAVLPQYFVKKRILASGLAAAGSGFGGLIYPFIFRRLEPRIGFGWTVRLIGFLTLFFSAILIASMRSKLPPGKMRKIFDFQIVKEIPFDFLIVALFFGFMGIYVPFFYMGLYSLSDGINGTDMAFYYLPIMNGASLVSRIAMTFFADKTGPFNLLVPTLFVAGILGIVWFSATTVAGLTVIAALYGACTGIFLSLAIPCIAVLTKDLRVLGQRIGSGAAVVSIGVLIGTPISGAIVKTNSHYTGVAVFGGVVILAGSIFALVARYLIAGFKVVKV